MGRVSYSTDLTQGPPLVVKNSQPNMQTENISFAYSLHCGLSRSCIIQTLVNLAGVGHNYTVKSGLQLDSSAIRERSRFPLQPPRNFGVIGERTAPSLLSIFWSGVIYCRRHYFLQCSNSEFFTTMGGNLKLIHDSH